MERTPNIFDLSIPVLALDTVIFTVHNGTLAVVLIPGKNPQSHGKLILPGGIVARGESLESASDRILLENAGISGIFKEQLYTFGDPARDSRGHVVSVVYYALVSPDQFASQIDASRVQILPFHDMKDTTLAYDHTKIVRYARQRLIWKLEYTNIAQNILHDTFTLTALQDLYEAVFDRTFDKRNFRKKIMSLDLIRETGKFDQTSSRRPAKLYEFVSQELTLMDKRELI